MVGDVVDPPTALQSVLKRIAPDIVRMGRVYTIALDYRACDRYRPQRTGR